MRGSLSFIRFGSQHFLIIFFLTLAYNQSTIYKFIMNLLSQNQIKLYELNLLETSGPSLAQYAAKGSKANRSVGNNSKLFLKNKLNVLNSRSMGFSSNANLKGFISILLNTIYGSNVNQAILTVIKSTFYDSTINVTLIRHNPFPNLTNQHAKKLLVEFFYSLVYSTEKNKISAKLSKYPIVLDILITCLRVILVKFNVKYASNFLFQLPTHQVFSIFVGFFDLNCKQTNNLFLFYQQNMFILESDHQEILIGEYIEHQQQPPKLNSIKNWQNSSLTSSQTSFEFKRQDYQEMPSKNQAQICQTSDRMKSNRVLLKKIMFESVVYEPQTQEAPTPFFSSNIPSFNPKASQLRKSREFFSLDTKTHNTLADKANQLSQFNAIQQNEINQSDCGKDSMIKRQQSIGDLERRFSEKKQDFMNYATHRNFVMLCPQKPQTIKSLKKSKSQSSLQKKINEKDDDEMELSDNGRKQLKGSALMLKNRQKKNYSEYCPKSNKSNDNSESNLSQKKSDLTLKKSTQYVSNIYSINIENISTNQHTSSPIKQQEKTKTSSFHSRPFPIQHNIAHSKVSQKQFNADSPTFNSQHFLRHQSRHKYYNPEQRSTKQKQENPVKQFQIKLKVPNVNGNTFRRYKKGPQQSQKQRNNNVHVVEEKIVSNFLLDCPLSPISYNESLSSNAIEKQAFSRPKIVSFTYVSMGKDSSFSNNQPNTNTKRH